jgi:hypothetical protein
LCDFVQKLAIPEKVAIGGTEQDVVNNFVFFGFSESEWRADVRRR